MKTASVIVQRTFIPRRTRWTSFLTIFGIAVVCTTGAAHAEEPVNRCTDTGSSTSTDAGGASGDAYTPRKPTKSEPSVGAASALGRVDLKTGGLALDNEDIALGVGDFPARLSFVRTYRSDTDGPETPPLAPYKSSAKQWLAFGRSGTHNLDIRYSIGEVSFGGKFYIMIYIRRGLSSVSFQGCASGLKSSTQDGSRLSADTTYGSGGLLFEDRDGTKIYFQKVSLVPNKEMCHNNNSCGYARKIVSPNGDWLELNYEVYDSHPSNKPQVEHVAPWLMSTFATTQQCNVVWSGQTDCRYLNTPYYLIRNDGAVSAQGNKAVIDVRLVSTFNSRGYRLLFSYVDPTTTGLPLCTGSPFGGLTCSGSGNESLTRNRLASVTASYQNSSGGITPLGQVSYTYQSRYAGSSAEYLSTITALDGAVTRYDIFGNTFKIWQPGDTVPSSTITFDQGPAGYYYPEVDQNSPYSTPQRTLRYYDRVRTQAFATGELVNYDPTMQGKWIEESYGTFEWRQVTSEMKITVAGTQVTTLKYFDANGEHNRPLSTTNPDGSIVLNSYDASGSLVSSVNPEGNATGYTYDLRGNTVQRTLTPKPGSGLTAISEQWTYVGGPSLVAEACSNQKTCNRPDKYVNPRGDTTDYSWDSATGLIAQKLEPAAPDGLRPTSDFTYASIPASGGTTVLLLASVTAKIDATSSQSTQFEYTAEGRGLLKSKIDTAGSSSLRTCYGYDAPGNKISETAPRAGLSQCQ